MTEFGRPQVTLCNGNRILKSKNLVPSALEGLGPIAELRKLSGCIFEGNYEMVSR